MDGDEEGRDDDESFVTVFTLVSPVTLYGFLQKLTYFHLFMGPTIPVPVSGMSSERHETPGREDGRSN